MANPSLRRRHHLGAVGQRRPTTHGVARVAAAYLQDQSRVLAGVAGGSSASLDRFEVDFHNNRNGQDPTHRHLVSPRVGLVWKPRRSADLRSYSVCLPARAGSSSCLR
jgi:catecholate siderophore receptor